MYRTLFLLLTIIDCIFLNESILLLRNIKYSETENVSFLFSIFSLCYLIILDTHHLYYNTLSLYFNEINCASSLLTTMINGCIYIKDMNIINLYLIVNSSLHLLLYYSVYYIDVSSYDEIETDIRLFLKYIKNKKEKMCINICCICLDDNDKKHIFLNCGHSFHKKCLLKWFETNSSRNCPYCRQKNI